MKTPPLIQAVHSRLPTLAISIWAFLASLIHAYAQLTFSGNASVGSQACALPPVATDSFGCSDTYSTNSSLDWSPENRKLQASESSARVGLCAGATGSSSQSTYLTLGTVNAQGLTPVVQVGSSGKIDAEVDLSWTRNSQGYSVYGSGGPIVGSNLSFYLYASSAFTFKLSVTTMAEPYPPNWNTPFVQAQSTFSTTSKTTYYGSPSMNGYPSGDSISGELGPGEYFFQIEAGVNRDLSFDQYLSGTLPQPDEWFHLTGDASWTLAFSAVALDSSSPVEWQLPPAIVTQPQNTGACVGSSVTLSVNATGVATYQWYKDGQILPMQTSSSLTLASVQPSDAGDYTVELFNAADTVMSSPAHLTVLTPPAISSQPQGATAGVGAQVTFNVTASGEGLTYQWRKDGVKLAESGSASGTTTPTLSLASVTAGDAGNYDVVVRATGDGFAIGDCVSVISASAPLTVQVPNQPPIANPDYYTTTQNAALHIPAPGVLANDIDPDGDALTLAEVRIPDHGDVAANLDGSFTYTPAVNYVGRDCFRYIVSDGRGSTATNFAYISVTAVAGSALAWGSGHWGELGNGTFGGPSGASAVPVWVSALPAGRHFIGIGSGSQFNAALADDGSVWSWGNGSDGELGDGNYYTTAPTGTDTPAQALPLPAGRLVTTIAVGDRHTLALANDGTAWAWGLNTGGQLGIGATATDAPYGSSTPVQVISLPSNHRILALSGGGFHTLALLDDGTVWAWGSGYWGQLGNNALFSQVNSPIRVSTLPPGLRIIAVAAGFNHSLALASDGTVWAWGAGRNGQLGDGLSYSIGSGTPVQVNFPTPAPRIVSLVAKGDHNLALANDGTLWSWGYGAFGELGNGTFVTTGIDGSNVPVQVNALPGNRKAAAIGVGVNHDLAQADDGTLWAWGYGALAQLGDGLFYNTAPYGSSTPVQVGGLPAGSTPLAFDGGSGDTLVLLAGINQPPMANLLPNQSGTYGSPFSYTFSANTFTDVDQGETLSYSASGMPPGISFDPSSRTFSGVPTSVGGYTVTLTATDNGTPPLSASTTFTFTVSPAPLTVTGNSQTKTYGQPDPNLTYTVSGFRLSDTAASVLTGSLTRSAGETVAGSPYPISQGRLAANANYTIAFTGNLLTITPAGVSVSIDPANGIYGDARTPLSAEIAAQSPSTAIVNEGTITFTVQQGATVIGAPVSASVQNGSASGYFLPAELNAGTYSITATYAPVPTNPNFAQASAAAPAVLALNPKAMTVTGGSGTKVYGQALAMSTLGYSVVGLAQGDSITSITQTSAGSAASATVAGSPYAVVPSNPAGINPANYSIAYANGSLTVTKATPVLGWPPPADILYGTPLGAAQLDATASTDGTFSYVPEAGTVLGLGAGQLLSVGFTPADTVDYNSASATTVVNVDTATPIITQFSPNTTAPTSSDLTLSVAGNLFLPGAVLYWNGVAQPTTVLNQTSLTALIYGSELMGYTASDITLIDLTVANVGDAISSPAAFPITVSSVGTVQSGAALPGQTVTVSDPPTSSGASGITATVNNAGSTMLMVSAATYSAMPPSGLIFDAGANYYDIKVQGAAPGDSATLNFYYPSTVIGSDENKLRLTFFNGTTWVPVWSSGKTGPTKNTTDNLDNTVSGGRFTVVFDSTSTPALSQLSGSVFATANTTPVVTVAGPQNPSAVSVSVSAAISYQAVGTPDTQTIRIDWADGTSGVVMPTASGKTSATHAYTVAGVYTVKVTVTDANGDSGTGQSGYVVIYNPNSGFVTGGGWITSPSGAYPANPSLTGKANFGFVSKYQKGAQVPSGQTQFQFQTAGLDFHSTSYDWLVVSGARAQFKGSGTINGTGDYAFILTAIDGQVTGGGGVDRFRIKIWDKASSVIVYDNQMGALDTADLTIAIGGGSITIQSGKN
jgi:alpha-tubulin suppressor-like RCC1 family protein